MFYYHLTISDSNKNEVKCREFINSRVEHIFRLQNLTLDISFQNDRVYYEKLLINEKKLDGIKNTLKFIPEEHSSIWKTICQWPSKANQNDEYTD